MTRHTARLDDRNNATNPRSMATRTGVEEGFERALHVFGCTTGILIGALMAWGYSAHLTEVVICAGLATTIVLVRVVHLCLRPKALVIAAGERIIHLESDRLRLERATGRRARACRAYEAFLPLAIVFMCLVPGWVLTTAIGWAGARPRLLFMGGCGAFLAVLTVWVGFVVASRRELGRLRASALTRWQP